jgi:nicotinate-nucleotide pyrophosphorylase (carboxylating)
MIFDIHHQEISDAVARAFYEDVGLGDLTSEACIPEGLRADGHFIARQKLVVAGVELLTLMFDKLTIHKRSGEPAESC